MWQKEQQRYISVGMGLDQFPMVSSITQRQLEEAYRRCSRRPSHRWKRSSIKSAATFLSRTTVRSSEPNVPQDTYLYRAQSFQMSLDHVNRNWLDCFSEADCSSDSTHKTRRSRILCRCCYECLPLSKHALDRRYALGVDSDRWFCAKILLCARIMHSRNRRREHTGAGVSKEGELM